MHCRSRSPAETQAIAYQIARAIEEPGLVVALCGPLGSGKTVFVRGLARGLEIDPERVTSPTFVIATQHETGRRVLIHVDLYRIETGAELEAAGWLDWLAPGAVVAVEWADRFPEALPDDHLKVIFQRELARRAAPEGSDPDARILVIEATGPQARRTLARVLESGKDPGLEESEP